MKEEGKIKKPVNQKIIWLVFGAFICVLFLLVFIVYSQSRRHDNSKNDNQDINSGVQPATNQVRRYLDGVLVDAGKENLYPIAVVLDNFGANQSQAGLSRANIVYEAEAEGRITRYLAVFADWQNIKEIGPIRSARPYFVEWAEEYSALFVHCGGSPEALVKIAKENIFDFNEFYNGKYFWRETKEEAPHNVYTSGKQLDSYLEKKQIGLGKFLTWNFKDDALLGERPTGQKMTVKFKGEYAVNWQYDQAANEYLRFLNGKQHQDKDGKNITAKNVIIQYVPATEIDEDLRIKMDTIGSGEALVCLDGKCEPGEWRKKNSGARTRFYKVNKEEVSFNTGSIWIEVVRPEYKVEY